MFMHRRFLDVLWVHRNVNRLAFTGKDSYHGKNVYLIIVIIERFIKKKFLYLTNMMILITKKKNNNKAENCTIEKQ